MQTAVLGFKRWAALCFGLTLVFAQALPSVAEAAPIKYEVAYTSVGLPGSVGSFNFSFELPDFVSSEGMFALPAPITVPVGASPGANVITHAGTDSCGNWIFGTANEALFGACSFGLFFSDGPAFALMSPATAGFITAPASIAFAGVTGHTQNVVPQFSYAGTATLTVTDLAVAPEPASLVLLGIAGAAFGVRRRRRV